VRTLVLLFAVGCGADHGSHPIGDASASDDAPSFPDADLYFCDATADSAHVTVTDAGTATTYSRIHAGALIESGPVAPVNGIPMTIQLMFTDADHFSTTDGFDCIAPDYAGCPFTGALARTDSIPYGAEVGTHPVVFDSLTHAGLDAHGTLTIDAIIRPVDAAPGHIRGSVTTTSGADSVTGTFENNFCLLTATI